jgi:hypothetical protein
MGRKSEPAATGQPKCPGLAVSQRPYFKASKLRGANRQVFAPLAGGYPDLELAGIC